MSWLVYEAGLWSLWIILVAIGATGGLVAFRAVQAYRSRRTRPLLFLGAGIGVLAVGMPVVWFMAYMVTDDLLWCSLAAAVAILVGFVLVLLSLAEPRGEPLPLSPGV